jgi:hypothetical protein
MDKGDATCANEFAFVENNVSERETNMRKMTLFKVLVVLVLCVVGLGFYRGWFVLASHGGGDEGNKVEVQLTVDPDKAKDDATAVGAKARELTGSKSEETPSDPPEVDVHEDGSEGAISPEEETPSSPSESEDDVKRIDE